MGGRVPVSSGGTREARRLAATWSIPRVATGRCRADRRTTVSTSPASGRSALDDRLPPGAPVVVIGGSMNASAWPGSSARRRATSAAARAGKSGSSTSQSGIAPTMTASAGSPSRRARTTASSCMASARRRASPCRTGRRSRGPGDEERPGRARGCASPRGPAAGARTRGRRSRGRGPRGRTRSRASGRRPRGRCARTRRRPPGPARRAPGRRSRCGRSRDAARPPRRRTGAGPASARWAPVGIGVPDGSNASRPPRDEADACHASTGAPSRAIRSDELAARRHVHADELGAGLDRDPRLVERVDDRRRGERGRRATAAAGRRAAASSSRRAVAVRVDPVHRGRARGAAGVGDGDGPAVRLGEQLRLQPQVHVAGRDLEGELVRAPGRTRPWPSRTGGRCRRRAAADPARGSGHDLGRERAARAVERRRPRTGAGSRAPGRRDVDAAAVAPHAAASVGRARQERLELLRLPDRLHARSMAGREAEGRRYAAGDRPGTALRPGRRGPVRATSPIQTSPSSNRSAFQIGARAFVSSIA